MATAKTRAARENIEGSDAPGKADLHQVVEIVSSYVRHNTIAAENLPRVIADVYRALAGAGQLEPVEEKRRPAVPIHRSVGQGRQADDP